MGFGKQDGRMNVSIQAFLLKKILSTLSHTYKGCVVGVPSTVKTAGAQPIQGIVEPPTTMTFLSVGISSSKHTFSLEICWGPAKQILAPLSGKMFMFTGAFGELE